jgi:hypothetical protein
MFFDLMYKNQTHGSAGLGVAAGKPVFRGWKGGRFYLFGNLVRPGPLEDLFEKGIQPDGEEEKYDQPLTGTLVDYPVDQGQQQQVKGFTPHQIKGFEQGADKVGPPGLKPENYIQTDSIFNAH